MRLTRVLATRFARGLLAPLSAAVVLTAVHSPSLWAQDLITSGDLATFEAPEPDARIAYGEGEFQFGNLRLPEGAGPHPVVIFIHGGCWLSLFDITHAGPLEQALADEGYAVWSLEYRRLGNPGGGWPGTFHDIASGIDHLWNLASEYSLDLNRVIGSGHSAGGHLALWAAARTQIPAESELYAERPLPIHGVLALAPAADLETLEAAGVCGEVVTALMGGSPEAVPDHYDSGSPMRLQAVDVPQRLVIGAHDRNWAPGGRSYFETARAAGRSQVSLREAPDSGHFEMIAPTTSTWSLVIEELRALIRNLR